MYRIFFKKKTLKLQRKKLIKVYYKLLYAFKNFSSNKSILYKTIFILTLPKRQQFFSLIDLQTKKFYGLSSGRLLSNFGRKAKFFKRSVKNCAAVSMQLKASYSFLLKYIYLYIIKNFNQRQVTFFKKFLSINDVKILYFLHKQSFIPRFLPQRRIKKKILKSINLQ